MFFYSLSNRNSSTIFGQVWHYLKNMVFVCFCQKTKPKSLEEQKKMFERNEWQEKTNETKRKITKLQINCAFQSIGRQWFLLNCALLPLFLFLSLFSLSSSFSLHASIWKEIERKQCSFVLLRTMMMMMAAIISITTICLIGAIFLSAFICFSRFYAKII